MKKVKSKETPLNDIEFNKLKNKYEIKFILQKVELAKKLYDSGKIQSSYEFLDIITCQTWLNRLEEKYK